MARYNDTGFSFPERPERLGLAVGTFILLFCPGLALIQTASLNRFNTFAVFSNHPKYWPMKLKGPGNRTYNILFHLHTVSGISLSAVLYVIFLAGAFTLFKNEFYLWENADARHKTLPESDPRKILEKVNASVEHFDLNDDTFISFPSAKTPLILVYGHRKPPGSAAEVHYSGKMNPVTLALSEQGETAIGETLYRLHFLDQIPYAGRFLAGFVSVFFVFSLVTGVLIHWKNLFTKFWSFSLKGVRKQIWTNAHTVFGILGLPFQLMYAVTGAFYLLLALVLMPAVMVLFDGVPEKVYALAFPAYGVPYQEEAAERNMLGKLPLLHRKVLEEYGEKYEIIGIQTHHLLKEDAVVNYRVVSRNPAVFSSHGYIGYRLTDGARIYSSLPEVDKKFKHKIVEAVMHLHFGTFGGVWLKMAYFILSLLTCFMLISGVLLWREARNNRQYTFEQKRFHHRVTIVCLAVCLSLFPAIAVLFAAERLVGTGEGHVSTVNTIFFGSWAILTLVGLCLNKEAKLARFYTGALACISLTVPVVNGLTTSDWFWQTPVTQVWLTDVCWLAAGLLSAGIVLHGHFTGRDQPEGAFVATDEPEHA